MAGTKSYVATYAWAAGISLVAIVLFSGKAETLASEEPEAVDDAVDSPQIPTGAIGIRVTHQSGAGPAREYAAELAQNYAEDRGLILYDPNVYFHSVNVRGDRSETFFAKGTPTRPLSVTTYGGRYDVGPAIP